MRRTAGAHRGWMEDSTHLLVTLVILGVLGGGEWDWDGVEGAVVVEAPLRGRSKNGTGALAPSPLGSS